MRLRPRIVQRLRQNIGARHQTRPLLRDATKPVDLLPHSLGDRAGFPAGSLAAVLPTDAWENCFTAATVCRIAFATVFRRLRSRRYFD